jgi:hypothetical protein
MKSKYSCDAKKRMKKLKGNKDMYHPYISEKQVQLRQQELLAEAEQQRLAASVVRGQPNGLQLMFQTLLKRFSASTSPVAPQVKTATGQL